MENKRNNDFTGQPNPPLLTPPFLPSQILPNHSSLNYPLLGPPHIQPISYRPHPDQSELSVFSKEDVSDEDKTTDLDIPDETKKKSHSIAEKKRRDTINLKIKELYSLVSQGEDSPSKAVSLQRIVEYVEKLKDYSNQLNVNISNMSKENERLEKQLVFLNPVEPKSQVPISKIVSDHSDECNIEIINMPSEDLTDTSDSESEENPEKTSSKKVVLLSLFMLFVFCIPSSFKLAHGINSSRAILALSHSRTLFVPNLLVGILAHMSISLLFLPIAYIFLSAILYKFSYDLLKSSFCLKKEDNELALDRLYMKHLTFKLYTSLQRSKDPIPQTIVTMFLCFTILRYLMQRIWVGRFVDAIFIYFLSNIAKAYNVYIGRCEDKIDEERKAYYTLKVWESLLYYEFGLLIDSNYAINLGHNAINQIPKEKLRQIF